MGVRLFSAIFTIASLTWMTPTHALSLKQRCAALVARIGEEELVRKKNDREYTADLLRDMWVAHFTEAHKTRGPYALGSELLGRTQKFMEMQRDLFNDWHQDTGLVATVEWQTTDLVGRIVPSHLHGATHITYPYLRFRYDPKQRTQPVSSFLGQALKYRLTGKDRVDVAYDPLRSLLMSSSANGQYIATGGNQLTPRILMNDGDLFAIDTLPSTLLHEGGHHDVESDAGRPHSDATTKVHRFVFGEVSANESSNVFHSQYLNGAEREKPWLSLDEIYTYWISLRSSLFNLDQVLGRKQVPTREVERRLKRIHENASNLSAIAKDTRYVYREIETMLSRPTSPINLRRENGKLYLQVVLNPSAGLTDGLRVNRDQIPPSLRLTVEIPIELDPPQLWAIRFAEVIGGASAANGTYPLPQHLRGAFSEHMQSRLHYLETRSNRAESVAQKIEAFLEKNPSPTREQVEVLSREL